MDTILFERITEWEEFLPKINMAEMEYFNWEAKADSFYSKIYLKTSGKNIEERKAQVMATDGYEEFQKILFQKKAEYLSAKRKLELIQKKYEGEYGSLKRDYIAINNRGNA
jgi:hypothetical protein